jgi:hypothetical protein
MEIMEFLIVGNCGVSAETNDFRLPLIVSNESPKGRLKETK